MSLINCRRNLLALVLMLSIAPELAAAQTYPAKAIHIIVPFAPGGITDVIARALGQRLSEAWKQQIVVENRPTGAGIVGVDAVAKVAPDGHTLLVAADANFVTARQTYSKLPYDPFTDFAPITGLGISPQALIVHPSVPVRTFGELIEHGKRKPGELNYGTFGIGTSGHLNIVLLESLTGARFAPVHYRGATPALPDTTAGHIQMMIGSIGLVAQPGHAGQFKVLGFGSATRIAQYRDGPTLAESGLHGYEAGSWYGLFAPASTPRAIIDKLNAETQRIFTDPQFRERVLASSFITSIVSSPEDFAARIRADSAKWGKVIRDASIKAE